MQEIRNRERFARSQLLIQEEGLDRLEAACVMVLGLGGVGGSCVEALARSGVGHLIVVDMDVVDVTNVNRQAIAFTSTIGRPKAAVMAEMVREINPACRVEALEVELKPENVTDLLGQFRRPDYVIECIDLVFTKAAIAAWCQEEGLPIVASMGAANKFDPLQLTFADIQETVHCRLSKMMRREYRKVGVTSLEVLYSKELPVKIHNPLVQDRAHTLGTMSYMPPMMGQTLASLVIRRLVGIAD